MLERFKVPADIAVRVPEPSLRNTVAAVFRHGGMTAEDAAIAADVLVSTDLRGNESHGVSNELKGYYTALRQGNLNPRPGWRVVRELAGTAVIDGDRGSGIVMCVKAMRLAIEKARTAGVAVVNVFNSGHCGAVGHYAAMAAADDMVGFAATNAGGGVAPTFGAEGQARHQPTRLRRPGAQRGAVVVRRCDLGGPEQQAAPGASPQR